MSIIKADARALPLKDESVLNAGLVQQFASFVESIDRLDIFIGKRPVCNRPNGSVLVCEWPVSRDFRSVFSRIRLEATEFQYGFGGFLFDAKERQNRFQHHLCRLFGCLEAIEGAALRNAGLFFVVPTTQGFRDEANCGLVYHPDLYSRMVSIVDSTLAFIRRRLLYPDVPFTIDDPSYVRNINSFHGLTLTYIVVILLRKVVMGQCLSVPMLGIYPWRTVACNAA